MEVLGLAPRGSSMLSTRSTTERHPPPRTEFLNVLVIFPHLQNPAKSSSPEELRASGQGGSEGVLS